MNSMVNFTKRGPEAEAIGHSPFATKSIRLCIVTLVVLLAIDVWYRAHTFGPTVRDFAGLQLWPASIGDTEPLDCDEAAYAYIGHRILSGDVLYRDLTENKPPLGYWLYELAIALGGYNELTIRVMPIPFVLATMAIVWMVGLRLGGAGSGSVAAAFFMILSTDPYLFGNGANLEHFINCFSAASLGLLVLGWNRSDRWCLLAAGACLGAAVLVKQVALVHAFTIAPFLLVRSWSTGGLTGRRLARGVGDVGLFLLGLVIVAAVAALVLASRGAGQSAYEDIVLYGRALATDTLADPFAPPTLFRWLTGNADPRGRLPWPFGTTDWLVWWGAGSWPLWLASVPSTIYLLAAPKTTMLRRLTAVWMISACIEVVLPGLYWQHYYLLPIAGVSITVAVCLTDGIHFLARCIREGARSARKVPPILIGVSAVVLLVLAGGATAFLQVRDYLLVAPEQLTIRYKGGQQWVALRQLGRELARRASTWKHPHLYIWGWQSPLHFYSKLDSPTRHFFVDNLLRDQADRKHPLIEPRTREILTVLKSRPPELIFTGYPPFRGLGEQLQTRYLPSRWARGLWIRSDAYARFEAEREGSSITR